MPSTNRKLIKTVCIETVQCDLHGWQSLATVSWEWDPGEAVSAELGSCAIVSDSLASSSSAKQALCRGLHTETAPKSILPCSYSHPMAQKLACSPALWLGTNRCVLGLGWTLFHTASSHPPGQQSAQGIHVSWLEALGPMVSIWPR